MADDTIQNSTETIISNTAAIKDQTAAVTDATEKLGLQEQITKKVTEELHRFGDTERQITNILNGSNNVLDSTNKSFGLISGLINAASKTLSSFSDAVKRSSQEIDSNNSLTEKQITLFGLASKSILGVRDSFNNLSGIDYSSLNGFESQLTQIKEIIGSGLFGDVAAASLNIGKAFGLKPEELSQGSEAIFRYAAGLAKQADNAARLQSVMLQLAARNGTLNNIYDAAGDKLQNVNQMLSDQEKILAETASAINIPKQQLEQYYNQLGKIPGALTSIVSGSSDAGTSINLLGGAALVAAGSGRQFSDITEDLREAFVNYNITGEKALEFTARIGEIASNAGIDIEDVQAALRGTSNEFKMFGNEAEGAAAMMNQYVGSLKDTGISGNVAVGIVSNMTSQLSKMNVAQRGFLSAQTGGPGGLLGSIQIEKELREGKIDKVFDRVRQTLSKQFGNIVTLETANTPQATAQLIKQREILKSGPLGQFARSDEEANRILESFKSQNEGKVVKPLSETITKDVMGRGEAVQNTTNNILSKMLNLMEAARGQANVSTLTLFQDNMGARRGQSNTSEDTESGTTLRDKILSDARKAAKDSAEITTKSKLQLSGQHSSNLQGQYEADIIRQGKENVLPALKLSGKSLAENTKRLFNENNTNAISEEENKKNFNAAMNQADQTPTETGSVLAPDVQQMARRFGLGDVALRAASVNAKNIAPINVTAGYTKPNENTAEPINGEITVHVEGFCLDCGDKIKGRNQSFAVNTAQRAKK